MGVATFCELVFLLETESVVVVEIKIFRGMLMGRIWDANWFMCSSEDKFDFFLSSCRGERIIHVRCLFRPNILGLLVKAYNELIASILSTVPSLLDLYMFWKLFPLIQNGKETIPTILYKLLLLFTVKITNAEPYDRTHLSVREKRLCLGSDEVDSSIPFV